VGKEKQRKEKRKKRENSVQNININKKPAQYEQLEVINTSGGGDNHGRGRCKKESFQD